MFIVEYKMFGIDSKESTNDIRNLVDIVIGIADDKELEKRVYDWASRANFGDTFINNKYNLRITCAKDEINNEFEETLKKIAIKISSLCRMPIKDRRSDRYTYGFNDAVVYYSNNRYIFEIRVGKRGPIHTCIDKNAAKLAEEAIRIIKLIKPLDELQLVANEITKQTGIENEFIGEDNDALTWDFAIGTSYMKNNGDKGLFFALNDDSGAEICTVNDKDKKEFVRKTVTVIKRLQMSRCKKSNNSSNKTKSNKDISRELKDAIKNNKEWHDRVYYDGCWWIDIERLLYGQIRFWVGFEDKRSGNSKQSLVSICRYNGELNYSCGFKIKDKVLTKVLSVYKSLEAEGMIN